MFLLRLRAALPLPPPATARIWGMPATGHSRKRALVVPAAGHGSRIASFFFFFFFDLLLLLLLSCWNELIEGCAERETRVYARRRGGKKAEVVEEARLVSAEPPLREVIFYHFFSWLIFVWSVERFHFFAFWSIHWRGNVNFITSCYGHGLHL